MQTLQFWLAYNFSIQVLQCWQTFWVIQSPVMGSQWAESCQDWLTAFWGQPKGKVRGRYLDGKSRNWKVSSHWILTAIWKVMWEAGIGAIWKWDESCSPLQHWLPWVPPPPAPSGTSRSPFPPSENRKCVVMIDTPEEEHPIDPFRPMKCEILGNHFIACPQQKS